MVETLIFETPTPLPEHAEREFFPSANPTAEESNGLNDSGIELQEEWVLTKFLLANQPSFLPKRARERAERETFVRFRALLLVSGVKLAASRRRSLALSQIPTAALSPVHDFLTFTAQLSRLQQQEQ
jgi:hypothetical protein